MTSKKLQLNRKIWEIWYTTCCISAKNE